MNATATIRALTTALTTDGHSRLAALEVIQDVLARELAAERAKRRRMCEYTACLQPAGANVNGAWLCPAHLRERVCA